MKTLLSYLWFVLACVTVTSASYVGVKWVNRPVQPVVIPTEQGALLVKPDTSAYAIWHSRGEHGLPNAFPVGYYTPEQVTAVLDQLQPR